ncbi:MAG: hypothetical protein GY950_20700, partial [bacterium]|nr:hypothetical protein [bacterium]
MFKKPRLKYNFHTEFLDEERVLLLSEKKNSLLTGKLYNLVLAGIQKDGVSLEELVQRLEGRASAAEIIFALTALKKEGYVTESVPSEVPPELSAYWNGMGMDVNTLVKVLEEKRVSIETVGTASALSKD